MPDVTARGGIILCCLLRIKTKIKAVWHKVAVWFWNIASKVSSNNGSINQEQQQRTLIDHFSSGRLRFSSLQTLFTQWFLPSFLPSFALPFTFHFPLFSSRPHFLFCFLLLPSFLCSSSPPSSLISFLPSSLFIPTSPNYNLSPLLSIYSNFYLILFSSLTYFPPPSFFPLYHPFITACSLLLSCPRPPSSFNLFLLSYLSPSPSSLPLISVLWERDY